MNNLLAIPIAVRLLVLFGIGAWVGGWVNWAVYRLAERRRTIGPWTRALPAAPLRHWSDWVPVVGWLGLRREAKLHGKNFWVRPLVVELLLGSAFAGLYWFELRQAESWWQLTADRFAAAHFLTNELALVVHLQFVSHALLITLMLAASLVDLDEQTIPDGITITGTLIGLALAVASPWSLPIASHQVLQNERWVGFLTLATPAAWPTLLDGWPAWGGLITALGCWTLWCGGLLPRVWRSRRGLSMALRVFWCRLWGSRLTYFLLLLWPLGMLAIVGLAFSASPAHWAGFLSALVGLAGGGASIWIVRNVGQLVLGREAMGFGDVTLMAMIGAFIGWQGCLLVFFIAPCLALLIAGLSALTRGDREIPYGPYLCLATLLVVLKWPTCWQFAVDYFALGQVIPVIFGGGLLLMAPLLWLVKRIEPAVLRLLGREFED